MKNKKNSTLEPDRLKTESSDQFFFTSEHVREWIKKGLPQELAYNYLDQIEKQNESYKKFAEFKKNNPNPTPEDMNKFLELPRILSKEEQEQNEKNYEVIKQFQDFLSNNWESLITKFNSLANIKKKKTGLFKGVNLDDSFGISTALAYLMYHLDTLLKNSELKKAGDKSWEIEGKIQNSNNENIILTYDFDASTEDEAKILFENYKDMMSGKGLRAWMAYWMVANEIGSTECVCPMIEVMKCIPKEGRKANFFSGHEKQEHWDITKKLRRTYISIEKTVYNKSKKPMSRWVQQPLLTILGGEQEIENSVKYPTTIAFRVLATQKKTKGFFPAIYKNKTLQRPTNRIFLAFIIQTRAAQREHGEKRMHFDWPFLFLIGNLENTAKSNPRAAKSRIRKEMEELKKDIINEYIEDSQGINIIPKSQINTAKDR